MADVFEDWNKGELDSFLIEITRDILKFKDADGKSRVGFHFIRLRSHCSILHNIIIIICKVYPIYMTNIID